MKTSFSTVAITLTLALAPLTASAQVRPGGPPGQRPQRQELENRLQQGFGRMVAGRLGLDRDGLAALQQVMQSFRENRMALNQDQAALRHRLRNPGLEEMGEAEARALLNEMIRVQEAELELYRREQAELQTVLSPTQLVLFYSIRDEWGARIQQMRQGGGPGGPGGFGPPGGPGGTQDWTGGMGGTVDWDEGFLWFR